MAQRRRAYALGCESPESETAACLTLLRQCPVPRQGQAACSDELVALAGALARAGRHLEEDDRDEDDEIWPSLWKDYRNASVNFVKYLQGAGVPPLLSAPRKEHGLNGEELEILLMLAAGAIGAARSIDTVRELQDAFPRIRRTRMQTARLLLPESRLVASGLVQLDEETAFKDSSIAANPSFVEAVLRGKGTFTSAWNCETQEELLKKLPLLQKAIEQSAEYLDYNFDAESARTRKQKRELDRFVKLFLRGVRTEWALARAFTPDMDATEAILLLALLADAVLRNPSHQYLISGNETCSGEALASAAADSPDERNGIVRNCLSSSSRLVRENLIEPVLSGTGEMREDDEDELRNLAFRLTDSCLAALGVKRRRGKSGGRRPLLRMEQLELSPDVRQSLDLAVGQYACRDVLDSWQLGKTIAYGRAVTMLFYGPPGVGKTAAAEAVAAALKKRILVADYSRIQNCWVGETEKNIVRLFAKAREDDCVLFWDEADAMFYDRETASHNWEVRDVNVLLQELERFDGVCILSTNRCVQLDKALARRISLKIEFKPPTREQALSIWHKLLPEKLPLAKNVDFAKLSSAGLTGGEIKNVILNAARRAAFRGGGTKLEMADFDWALAAEMNGKDAQGQGGRKIGFHCDG